MGKIEGLDATIKQSESKKVRKVISKEYETAKSKSKTKKLYMKNSKSNLKKRESNNSDSGSKDDWFNKSCIRQVQKDFQ